MSYEQHFAKQETVKFEVEGAEFEYKPATAGDENDWLGEYMVPNGNGGYEQSFSLLNKCKMRNLVKAPYAENWSKLNHEQRWELLGKLKPSIFSQIMTKINKIDSDEVNVKN